MEGITDRIKQQERVNQEKDNIINFLTGMENSGKVLFSTFCVSPNGEEQHDYFAATMFPCFDIIHQLGFFDHIWLRYQDVHAQLLTIEQRLETECFSKPLMDTLRTANILSKWDMTLDTAQYKRIYQCISAIEFSILRIGEYPIPSIIDTINIVRSAKGNVFAEWKQSDTAKLFQAHGYKNKKESSGYFF